MSKVFITGIAGFLGSHLADALIAEGHSVSGIDNLIGGELANVPKAAEFRPWDCRDLRSSDLVGVDVVYHCAATAYEGLSVFSPRLVTDHIVAASVSVFSAAIGAHVSRIVYCSSMARYGHGEPPFKETDPTAPVDPYGIGKVAAEDILKCLCAVHGVDYVIAVPHNIYGPRQKYDDPYRNVASIMMNRMHQALAPVIYGDGFQQRCFSYVDDCIHCLVKMGFDRKVIGETINIGPDTGEVTIYGLYRLLKEITGYKGLPTYMDARPLEVKYATCSADKARKLLAYEARTTLRGGLLRMYKAYLQSGPKPFDYHLDLEIVTDKTPATWRDKLL